MKTVVLIERATEYRMLGPIVDAALGRGWPVECWHNYGWTRSGLKGYQFPEVSVAPAFRHGRPEFNTYHSADELQAWLRETRADVIVAMRPPPGPTPRIAGRRPPLWLALHHAIDFFLTYTPDEVLTCDVVGLYSDWWCSWMIDYFAARGLIADRDAFARTFVPRATFSGFTALDPAPSIDAEEIRARWQIPPGRPVVTLLPFPQGVGKSSFWPRKVFGEPNRLRQMVNVAAHRRFEYWPEVRSGPRDIEIVKAVRRFCDRQGAFLLVKSRRKTPIPPYTEAVADRCLYDERYWPSTVLEALSISNLCISYYSLTVTEAVPMGVPHLCITFGGEDYCGSNPHMRGYFDRFFNRQEGGVFQFEGATTTVEIPDAVGLLDRSSLGDFRVDPAARRQYVSKFLGHDDFNASGRLLDRLEQAEVHGVAESGVVNRG